MLEYGDKKETKWIKLTKLPYSPSKERTEEPKKKKDKRLIN